MNALRAIAEAEGLTDAERAQLRLIEVDAIIRNPENPRLVFREEELEDLMHSIHLYNVQVPISVYREGKRFVLIDGERRWICSQKLNREKIPALIQEKPSALDNLLLMFNIHSLREQWDTLTIAMKLTKIIDLLKARTGKAPTESQIKEHTGLNRTQIRRSKYLLELPEQYRAMILTELHKPKAKQKLSEDFFIEMEKSLRTVAKHMPDVIPNKDAVRQTLLKKYERDVIRNLVDLRDISKIARAEDVGSDVEAARRALKRLFQDNTFSIKQAYETSVSEDYAERDILGRIQGLITRLHDFPRQDIDDDVREQLRELVDYAELLLREDAR